MLPLKSWQLALFLVAIVGFNLPMSWVEPARDERGKLSVQALIFTMATYLMERWYIPKWAYWLGCEKLKRIDEAYTSFPPFMKKRIAERENELKKLRTMEGQSEEERAILIKDVFGRLMDARLSGGKWALSDEEIIGNSFVFVSQSSCYYHSGRG